jgi:hypothetical protein
VNTRDDAFRHSSYGFRTGIESVLAAVTDGFLGA